MLVYTQRNPMLIKHNIVKEDGFNYAFFGKQDRAPQQDVGSNITDHYVKIVADEFKIKEGDVYHTNQQHTNIVHIITHKNLKQVDDIVADALVTNIPNIAIYIKTADCVPLIFIDYKNKVIGIAHVGWRGQLNNIIHNTVIQLLKLGADTNYINVIVGPCIRKKSYEVGADFLQLFTEQKPDTSDFFIKDSGSLKFDLVAHACDLILKERITAIYDCCIDTYINEDFFSHRRAVKSNTALEAHNISAIILRQ